MDHWVVHLRLEKQSAYGMYLLCHIKTIMNLDIITNIDPGAGGLKLPPDVNVSFMACLDDLQTSLYTDHSVVTVVM